MGGGEGLRPSPPPSRTSDSEASFPNERRKNAALISRPSVCPLVFRQPAAVHMDGGFFAPAARGGFFGFCVFLNKKRVSAAKRRAILSLYASPPNGGAKAKSIHFREFVNLRAPSRIEWLTEAQIA